jgi:signal transduction histidine kinase
MGDFQASMGLGADVPAVSRRRGQADRHPAPCEARVLEMVAAGAPLKEILSVVSLSVESRIPGLLCSFFLLDSDGSHLRLVAAPSLPPEFAEAVSVRTVHPELGSPGPADSQPAPAVFNETLRDAQQPETGHLGGRIPIRFCCSVPIVNHHGTMLGSLSAYHGGALGLSPDEMRLLESASRLGGIALQRDRADEMLREAEIQLSQSQKIDTIGQLAGEIVHDFNNMLTSMNAYLGLIASSEENRDQRAELVQGAQKTVERASALTRQLLRFSRQDSIRFQKIDLNEVVTGLAPMFQRLFDRRISLEAQLAPGSAVVHGDRGMLDQIITNLTLNARDSMPHGGRLVLRVGIVGFGTGPGQRPSQTKSGTYACLTVSDSGCGIPPQHLRRIFEPFYTTKGEGKGTGLGLATVFRLVRTHCGWIEVESRVGRGSEFHVFLPLLENAADASSGSG